MPVARQPCKAAEAQKRFSLLPLCHHREKDAGPNTFSVVTGSLQSAAPRGLPRCGSASCLVSHHHLHHTHTCMFLHALPCCMFLTSFLLASIPPLPPTPFFWSGQLRCSAHRASFYCRVAMTARVGNIFVLILQRETLVCVSAIATDTDIRQALFAGLAR